MLTHVTLAPRNDRANGDDDNRAIENEALSSPALPCHASLLSTSMDGYQPATRTVLAPDLLCAACARMRFFISQQSKSVFSSRKLEFWVTVALSFLFGN